MVLLWNLSQHVAEQRALVKRYWNNFYSDLETGFGNLLNEENFKIKSSTFNRFSWPAMKNRFWKLLCNQHEELSGRERLWNGKNFKHNKLLSIKFYKTLNFDGKKFADQFEILILAGLVNVACKMTNFTKCTVYSSLL